MNNNKIAIFGTQEQGLDMAKYLKNNGYCIECFVTLNEFLAKENKVAGWIDYKMYAQQESIELYHCKSYTLTHQKDIDFLKQKNFNIVLLCGWQRLISKEIINSVNLAIIGQHGSSEFLPRGRGRSPLNWSIIENRKRLIWNIFKLSPGIDDGEIISFQICDINEWDDCRTLYYKVSIMVKQMALQAITKLLKGTLKTYKQIGTPSYYSKRTPKDGQINWHHSVYAIHNLIKAVTSPYPGAFSFINNKKVIIWKAQVFDSKITYPGYEIGTIIEVFSEKDFLINCVDGLLIVTEYEGCKPRINDRFLINKNQKL